MDERERAAWAAVAPNGDGSEWPDGAVEWELEHVRDRDRELATASTHPLRRLTGRGRIVFDDGTATPWRTAEERGGG